MATITTFQEATNANHTTHPTILPITTPLRHQTVPHAPRGYGSEDAYLCQVVKSNHQRLPPVRTQPRDEVTPLAEHVDEVEYVEDHLLEKRW